ncbi:hypothetical protein J3R30DRAFT_1568579 [Lentinula aciculospora]|uniref:Uncharacterized protein n=1 Tax=Lentinula aciculospora TaxID=153920 RepID=A0A9W9DGL4_9AGAR|nr:hypothetical protein J3R30DRAFT_1568579 [Lentinula aciculospora]
MPEMLSSFLVIVITFLPLSRSQASKCRLSLSDSLGAGCKALHQSLTELNSWWLFIDINEPKCICSQSRYYYLYCQEKNTCFTSDDRNVGKNSSSCSLERTLRVQRVTGEDKILDPISSVKNRPRPVLKCHS